MEAARELLWSDYEDDGMEGDGADDEMEEEVRPGRRRHRNPFIDDEAGVRRGDAKPTSEEDSTLSFS